MSESAKSLRSAMKSKAARLTKADPSQKVDSSDWTPPEPLDADVKTGMRPVSRRAFKKGGKVIAKCEGGMTKGRADRKARKAGGKVEKKGEQPLVDRWINRDNKKANEYRDGKKHVGGMKSGGRAKKEIGGALDAIASGKVQGLIPMAMGFFNKDKEKSEEKAKGGRAKKLGGGEVGANPLSEQAKMMGNAAMPQKRKAGGRTKKADGGRSPLQSEAAQYAHARRGAYDAYKTAKESEKATDKLQSEMQDEGTRSFLRDAAKKEAKKTLAPEKSWDRARDETGYSYAKGGKAKHPDVKEDKALIKQMVKPTAIKKAKGGGLSPFEQAFASARKAYLSGKGPKTFEFEGKKYGTDIKKAYSEPSTRGRGTTVTKTTVTKSSQPPMSMSSGQPITEAQRVGRALSRETNAYENYNDAINQKDADTNKAFQDLTQSIRDVNEERERAGQYYKKGGRLQRKAGGRASKKGKGKTHINIVIAAGGKGQDQSAPLMPPPGALRGPGAAPMPVPMPPAGGAPMPMPPAGAGGPPVNVNIPPATMQRKHGGKVYRSYKDMDAGAGSGEGRLEKTEIAARAHSARKAGGKVYRSYKDMDAGAGSGEGRLEKTEIEKRKRLH